MLGFYVVGFGKVVIINWWSAVFSLKSEILLVGSVQYYNMLSVV